MIRASTIGLSIAHKMVSDSYHLKKIFFFGENCYLLIAFLNASLHLYMRVCPSVINQIQTCWDSQTFIPKVVSKEYGNWNLTQAYNRTERSFMPPIFCSSQNVPTVLSCLSPSKPTIVHQPTICGSLRQPNCSPFLKMYSSM